MTHNLDKDPLEETQGDTFEKVINFSDEDDNPIDITGWTIYVTVKRNITDDDVDAVLSADVTSHDDAANGVTSFSFSASETESLSSMYFFEVKYEDDTGDVNTILSRRLEFNQAVRKQT